MTGILHWAKVLGDPVPNYNRDGNEWTFDFTPDEDGLVLLKKLGIADKLKNKGDDRENFIQFKQKEFRANGKRNDPISICDAANKAWDPEVRIGNKSVAEVKFRVVDYGKGKQTGVYPQALRILELVPYVRQEFAPLPEDNVYLKQYEAQFAPDDGNFGEDSAVEGDPLDA